MADRKNNNRGTAAPSVNPQGQGQDHEFSKEPKNQLEKHAKKDNTKI